MKRLFAGLGAVLVVGCAHTPAGGSDGPSPAEYYPLAVSNSWTYAINALGQMGEKTITVTNRDGEFFRDDSGNRIMIDGSGVRDDRRYLLQRPLVKGKTWKSVVSVNSVENYEIVETDQSVTVPAGIFEKCIVVRSTNPQSKDMELVNEMTFAPKVGIIRIQTRAVRQGESKPQVTLELKNYKLAAAMPNPGAAH